uniref:Metallophos domain-containing protein n=1 Tax=Elaeophora elaphi TaxID=1147741 RepID=A0A0R3RRK2_9BILA
MCVQGSSKIILTCMKYCLGVKDSEKVWIGDEHLTTHFPDLFIEKLRIPDHHTDGERALSDYSEKEPVVQQLAHQPNDVSKILKRIDLILSGHTHAGQFYVVWLLIYLKNDSLYGLYKIPNIQVSPTSDF